MHFCVMQNHLISCKLIHSALYPIHTHALFLNQNVLYSEWMSFSPYMQREQLFPTLSESIPWLSLELLIIVWFLYNNSSYNFVVLVKDGMSCSIQNKGQDLTILDGLVLSLANHSEVKNQSRNSLKFTYPSKMIKSPWDRILNSNPLRKELFAFLLNPV